VFRKEIGRAPLRRSITLAAIDHMQDGAAVAPLQRGFNWASDMLRDVGGEFAED
jgi:hypothetical protein